LEREREGESGGNRRGEVGEEEAAGHGGPAVARRPGRGWRRLGREEKMP